MSSHAGFPTAVQVHADPPRLVLELDAEVYPRDALYAAASCFLSRAFLLLDRQDAGGWRMTVTPRDAKASLRALAGEICNELLVAAARVSIGAEHKVLLEAVTRRAVSGAMGPPGLDDLESFDFEDDAFDDPLGIANSWEQRDTTSKPAKNADEGQESK